MALELVGSRNAPPGTALPSRSLAPTLVGSSDAFRYVRFRLEQAARTDAAVLLLGETGTGRRLGARFVHHCSARSTARFVSVDGTFMSAALIESDIFGGTMFVDEIGELFADAQAELARALECGELARPGSPHAIDVNVRVVAATTRNLFEDTKAGRFRRDLYDWLSALTITMPPLRERKDDIPALAQHLVTRLAAQHHRTIDVIPARVLDRLASYDWPRNMRELENVLERAIVTTPGAMLQLPDPLPAGTLDALPAARTTELVDVDRAHIQRVLHATGWRIEGPCGAAAALGLSPSTLRRRMRKLRVGRFACTPASPGE